MSEPTHSVPEEQPGPGAPASGPAPVPVEETIRRWRRGLVGWGVAIAACSFLAWHPFWDGPCRTEVWLGAFKLGVAFGIAIAVLSVPLSRFLGPREVTREHIYSFALALALALFIRTFVVQAFKIPSESMLPTLQVGDHILVNKFIYGVPVPFTERVTRLPRVRNPERGDIIVFRNPDDECQDYIKRIIGLPGETIEVRNRRIYIDGKPIDDPWGFCPDGRSVRDPTADCTVNGLENRKANNHRAFKVPEDHYFMMGDNRQKSLDSRFWSTAKTVHRDKIVGKAWRIYWSWSWDNGLRLSRLGDAVD